LYNFYILIHPYLSYLLKNFPRQLQKQVAQFQKERLGPWEQPPEEFDRAYEQAIRIDTNQHEQVGDPALKQE
jgi:hypothetical protein